MQHKRHLANLAASAATGLALAITLSAAASAAEVVLSSPWEVESMSISELLMSQKRWGRTRCRKFLQSIGMSENKSIGTLTERQRVTLAALLTAKAQSTRAQAQRAVA